MESSLQSTENSILALLSKPHFGEPRFTKGLTHGTSTAIDVSLETCLFRTQHGRLHPGHPAEKKGGGNEAGRSRDIVWSTTHGTLTTINTLYTDLPHTGSSWRLLFRVAVADVGRVLGETSTEHRLLLFRGSERLDALARVVGGCDGLRNKKHNIAALT
jgi:hypothetical protein